MGEVTFGACCVDDYSALALQADFLLHYGHSCLVPVDITGLPCMYIFVDIQVDVPHLLATIRHNFEAGRRLVLAGTIQFATAVQKAREELASEYPSLRVPQAKPLSPGEVLGCTAPVVQEDADGLVFVADGRFHLEAMMIANPSLPAFRYDPYGRVLTEEKYDHVGMRAARRAAVQLSRSARHWGLVLGTLGRQGNTGLLSNLQEALSRHGLSHTVVLMTEVTPAKLRLFEGIDAWIEVACPRLAIDWGEGFSKPTLTPYEALVALGEAPPWWEAPGDSAKCRSANEQTTSGQIGMQNGSLSDRAAENGTHGDPNMGGAYPMDYYAQDGGPWSSTHHRKPVKLRTAGPSS